MPQDFSPATEATAAWLGEAGTQAGLVKEADLEHELAALRAMAADPAAGVFGPGSMVWRIDREAAVFLAAGRALLLQLAHPWVAAAIAQHSNSLTDPIGRFHRTFGTVFAMVFGSVDQAVAAARRLYHRHAAINGVLTETTGRFAAGSAYCANDLAALRWVFATIADSALVAFELVNPPLSVAASEGYYTEIRRFAGLFGIPQSALPRTWPAFVAWFDEMLGSDEIAVGAAVRAIAQAALEGAGTWLQAPSWYRALTMRLLPPRLTQDFGLTYGWPERRSAERAIAVLRQTYAYLPPALRYVAPYREACARLAGHPPDPLTRVMNRVWIGRASLAG